MPTARRRTPPATPSTRWSSRPSSTARSILDLLAGGAFRFPQTPSTGPTRGRDATRPHPFGGTDRVIPDRGMPPPQGDPTFRSGLSVLRPCVEKEKTLL